MLANFLSKMDTTSRGLFIEYDGWQLCAKRHLSDRFSLDSSGWSVVEANHPWVSAARRLVATRGRGDYVRSADVLVNGYFSVVEQNRYDRLRQILLDSRSEIIDYSERIKNVCSHCQLLVSRLEYRCPCGVLICSYRCRHVNAYL